MLLELSFVKMGVLNFDDSYLVHSYSEKMNLISSVLQMANLNMMNHHSLLSIITSCRNDL